jgi:hypothetical protein
MTRTLIALKRFVGRPKEKRLKYCSTCARLASIEAHFDVGGVTAIEKYCDVCSKRFAHRSG